MKKRVNYLKIMVIVHGQSEYILARYIKSNLKIKMEIKSQDCGRSSVQITSVMNTLNNTEFKSPKSFFRKFNDIEQRKYNPSNFKLFIILDVDDCSEKQGNDFITKKMFEGHWLYDYIVPIYNIKNLEDVMNKCNIQINKKNKGEYFKIFPINHGEKDIEQIREFSETLKKSKCNSNLYEFVDYCLKIAEEY